jgi:integral membrane protein
VSDLSAFSGDRALHGAVLRYRVMAFIVGTALLVLTAIVILQYGFDLRSQMKTPEKIVAPIHGYLYLVYLAAAADLARRARWRIGRIVLVVCSGFVPFLAFIVEHRVYTQMQAEWAVEAAGTSAAEPVTSGPTKSRAGPSF